MKKGISKKIASLAVAFALSVSVLGGFAVPAYAQTTDQAAEIAALNKQIESLMRQLIALLQLHVKAIAAGGTVSKDDDTEDEDGDDEACDVDDNDDETTKGLTEAEADIFTNETLIKVEVDGIDKILVTEADTRAELIEELADTYDLSEDAVDKILELEEEDRASRASDRVVDEDEDTEEDGCSEDEEDNEDEDEDEDEDDQDED